MEGKTLRGRQCQTAYPVPFSIRQLQAFWALPHRLSNRGLTVGTDSLDLMRLFGSRRCGSHSVLPLPSLNRPQLIRVKTVSEGTSAEWPIEQKRPDDLAKDACSPCCSHSLSA